MFVNRLEKGVGAKDFYEPKNTDVLVEPQSFAVSSDLVSEEQKEMGLRLSYHPNLYVLKLNAEKSKPILTDISGHEVELPTTLALYKNREIVLNGFMLRVDNELKDFVVKSNDKDKHLSVIKGAVMHFNKLNKVDQQLSAVHELQHDKNRIAFEKIVDVSELTPKKYAQTRIADECSAFAAEVFVCADRFKKSGNFDDFNSEWMKPLVEELSQMPKEEREKFINNDAALLNKSIDIWMNTHENKTYMEDRGEFAHQVSVYFNRAENVQNMSADSLQYGQVIGAYFTFMRDGKEVDLSAHIVKDFDAPKHLYNGVETQKQSRKLEGAMR